MSHHFSSITVLIPDLKSGDVEAWNLVCEKFRLALTDKARRLFRTTKLKKGNPEDLVQETLTKAWVNRDSFRGDTTAQLFAWLSRILRNTFVDWNRGSLVEQNPATWYGFTGNGETPSAVAISHEQEANLYAGLAELEPHQAEILMLRHFEALKFCEIATTTQKNINTVVGLYRRGILKLNEVMKN